MIGILPAAGQAERMHGLPKYLLPIPDGYLLKRHIGMMLQRADCIHIGTHPYNEEELYQYTKYDRDVVKVRIAQRHETMSQTVLSLHDKDAEDNAYLFGMPDTYIEDDQCYAKLAQTLEDGADVAVATFHTRPEQRSKLGMLRLERGHKVVEVIDKPAETNLVDAWGALAWKPQFWEFLRPEDPHIGYALPRAIEANLRVWVSPMRGDFWDCGTPDEYFDLITHLHTEKV